VSKKTWARQKGNKSSDTRIQEQNAQTDKTIVWEDLKVKTTA